MTPSPHLTNAAGGQMRFVFIRHGIAHDVDGRCVGHTDVPLSEAGARSVRELQLARGIHKLFSSDLARAADTATILSERLALPVIIDARLREMNFGDWDGCAWREIERCDGERFSDWMDQWFTAAPPNGETVNALANRVASWLDEQLADAQLRDATIVVVAHAGPIRAAICLLTKMPFKKMFDISVEHARATVVLISASATAVTHANTLAFP
ncbi:MAG: alpha-ribazole phosphatase family protein [Gemmatimonadaceae bacterium]